jgi:4-amino-4-deoxy-L-arabinose transferase-like glycosyltransferase
MQSPETKTRQTIRWIWLLWVLALLLILLAALPMLSYPMGRDQGMYANIGRSILAGGTPFVDMWDIKPPPIYYIYAGAISLFGVTTSAIRAIDLIFLPLGMLAVFLLGRHIGRDESGHITTYGNALGIFATLAYGGFYFNEQFASLSQNDSLISVPLMWAIYFTLRSLAHKRASKEAWRNALWVGMLGGVILWFKHYNAFFLLAMVAEVLIMRRAFPVKEGLAFAIGGLLTGGLLLLFFASQGMVQEMFIVAQGTAAYNAQGYDFANFISNMGSYLHFRWLHWGTLLVLVVLWLPIRFLLPRKAHGWRLLWLTVLAGLAFAFIQAKGFDTHWMPMLPALALIGADTLARLGVSLASRFGGRLIWGTLGIAWSLLCVGIIANSTWARALPYYTGEMDQVAFFDQFQANDLKPEQSLQVVEYLRPLVAEGDTLFVWGFRPEVYYMGNWRPATRFQAHFPLVAPWYPPEWKDENVATLWAAMPPYAIVLEDDFMPWVTDYSLDSHQLLQDYTDLNSWYIANYERVHEIGDFLIWKRKDL